jgi:hypothetical protein
MITGSNTAAMELNCSSFVRTWLHALSQQVTATGHTIPSMSALPRSCRNRPAGTEHAHTCMSGEQQKKD